MIESEFYKRTRRKKKVLTLEEELNFLRKGASCNEQAIRYWEEYAAFIMDNKKRKAYFSSPYFQEELEAVSGLLEVKDGERWIDVGCGALPICEIFLSKERQIDLWAADIILAPARKVLPQIGNPPIQLIYMDLSEKLNIPDSFFDGITASKVLTYLPEVQGKRGKAGLKAIFQEMYRILKPGGSFIWTGSIKGVNRVKGTILALGYVMNVYQWIKQRYCLIKFASEINKIFKPLVENIREGRCMVLSSREEYEAVLEEIGFINPIWRTAFGGQVLINKVAKPY